MLRNLFTLAITGLAITAASAQTLRTVEEIQTVSAARLANCDDAPNFLLDTVIVRGVVLVRGGQAQSANGRQIWIRDLAGDGPFRNIGVRYGRGGAAPGTPTTPNDINNLVEGDTVEFTGTVEEFNGANQDGESQINPLSNGVRIIGEETGPAPAPALITNIGLLNNSTRLNNLTTGEAYEGNFIELQNVTVAEVTNFSSGARVSFTVIDAQGNRIEVSDRFLAQRLPPLGTFTAPATGDQFTSIKGIIIHNKNNCPSSGATNRGYTLNPFAASHYVRGASAPSIAPLTRTVISPCSTDAVQVNTTITDGDGTVDTAQLFYAIGETNNNYIAVPMTPTGSTYSASIPPQAEGTFVKYYVSATDNTGRTTRFPDISVNTNPIFYTVRCGAPLIRDLQYTPFTNGNSGYRTLNVTNVEGIVTSTANAQSDLGQVYIQQEGVNAWGGIWLTGGATISSLNRGDRVRVNGTVEENFGMTRIVVAAVTVVNRGNPITPVMVQPDILSTYSFETVEPLEGMLVTVSAAPVNLIVVDTNVLASGSVAGSNFGEYRLGTDRFNPSEGVIVLTGRVTNSIFSSKAVSYVNNIARAQTQGNGGPLNVPAQRVNLGDQFSSVTGQVYYGFNAIKLLPRSNEDMPGYLTQINERVTRSDLQIYPNPTVDGKLTVKRTVYTGTTGTSGLTDLSDNGCNCDWRGVPYMVYNSMGQPTGVHGYIIGEEIEINLSSLTAGIYQLVIEYPGAAVTETIVVQ